MRCGCSSEVGAARPLAMAARPTPYLRYFSSNRPIDDHRTQRRVLVVLHNIVRIARGEGRARCRPFQFISHRRLLELEGPIEFAWFAACARGSAMPSVCELPLLPPRTPAETAVSVLLALWGPYASQTSLSPSLVKIQHRLHSRIPVCRCFTACRWCWTLVCSVTTTVLFSCHIHRFLADINSSCYQIGSCTPS